MCVKHLIDCFANVTLLDNLEQSPLQIAMQKQYGDIILLLRTSSHGPLYMRSPNGFLPDVSSYPATGHAPHHQLVTPHTSVKKKKGKSAGGVSSSHAHKFLGSQVSYPSSTTPTTSSSHFQMSEVQGSSTHHHSPPTYPSHSPPLPPHCQPHNPYPSTSNHGHYSVATPTSSGYSDPHQQVDLPPVSSSVSHSVVEQGYPLYPTTTDVGVGTRPLQHLPMVSEVGIQTFPAHSLTPDGVSNPFVQPPYSPQSGGSQRSPQSAATLQASPNSISPYGASPQSTTPSPETQQGATIAVGTVGTVHVEGGIGYNYSSHCIPPHPHQTFMGSTPV